MNHSSQKRYTLRIMSVFFVAALSSCIAVISDNNGYNYFRAEGLSLREAAPSAIKYLRKYLNKSLIAVDTSIIQFNSIGNLKLDSVENGDVGEKVLSVAFVGDIMWIRDGWNSFLDENLRQNLSKYDVVIGNLETPVDTSQRVKSFLPDYARYNSDPALIRSFRKADGSNIFTALSLANNHAFDMGSAGLENTISFLRHEGILTTGAHPTGFDSPDYITIVKNGLRIGLYAAGWGLNDPEELSGSNIEMNMVPGLAPLQEEEIDITGITEALDAMSADSIDFRIIFLHWGYEFEIFPDPAIISTGRKIAEAGADMVVGTHPHVIQPFEVWTAGTDTIKTGGRKTMIAYSLGNFTTAMYTPGCRLGMIMSVNLYRNSENGTCEWSDINSFLVYNTSHLPGYKTRRTMLYSDYILLLGKHSPRKADRVRESLSPFNFVLKETGDNSISTGG